MGTVLFALTGTGFTIAKLVENEQETQNEKLAELDDLFIREDAAATKTETLTGEAEKKLTYDQTKKLDGQEIDIYKDSKNIEYRYDGDSLIGYYDAAGVSSGQEATTLTEKKAIQIATEHAQKMYSGFNKHTYLNCWLRDNGQISVYFATLYGKESFIRGSLITVTVKPSGVIRSGGWSNHTFAAEVDPASLSHVEQKSIDAETDRLLQEKYKTYNGHFTYEIIQYDLISKDGEYKIQVVYNVETPNHTTGDSIILDVPQKK